MEIETLTGSVKFREYPDQYKSMIVEAGECSWTWDIYTDSWDTGCGEKFQFITDGLTENGFKYCPYCGRIIMEVTNQEGI